MQGLMDYFKADTFAAVTQVKGWDLSAVWKLSLQGLLPVTVTWSHPMYVSPNFVLISFFISHVIVSFS